MIYNLAGLLILIIVIVLFLGIIRPSSVSWAYKVFKKSPQNLSRKFVIATALPALFISSVVLSATEPASIKAERAARERAALVAKQKAEQDENAKNKAETKRLNEQKQAAETARKKAEAEKQAAEAEKKKAEDEAKAAQEAAAKATPAPQPQTYYSAPAASSAPAPAAAPTNTVHPGSYCSISGARGVFSSGNPAVCAIDSKGVRLRWQSP